MIDPSDAAEPMENAEAIDPIDPIESADPTEPIDSTEPREPIESSESSDQSDHFEPDRRSAAPGERWSPTDDLIGEPVVVSSGTLLLQLCRGWRSTKVSACRDC
jgi:hypothetical protein